MAGDLRDMLEELEELGSLIPAMHRRAIEDIGREAVRLIRDDWPRLTGLSGDSWAFEPDLLVIYNPVDYTSFVHHGLADRLVPAVLEQLEPAFDQHFESLSGWSGA